MVFRNDQGGLRGITVQFLEESLRTLESLKEDMEGFPDSTEARKDWLRELNTFAGRARGLCERWKALHPDLADCLGEEPEELQPWDKKTPLELP